MRVLVELEPRSVESTRIAGEWLAKWGTSAAGGGIELAAAASLSALLDLRERCFEKSVTVNVFFPDNQEKIVSHG